MRILNNISTINTINKLNINNRNASTALERISSGLRINRAADDSAGLSITEVMRAQIRGLKQAERNVQDGISLIQVAEAGLGLIQNPNLQRLRELAIQASNETLAPEDRQNIQKEIDQIKDGIDEIANNTEFNNIKVLRPPVHISPPTPPSGKVDVVFVIDNTGSMSGIQTTVANNITNFINSISSKGVNDIRMGVVEFTDSDIHKSNFSDGIWTNDITEISNEILELASNNRGGIENTMEAITKAANDYTFRDNEGTSQTKHIIFVTNEPGDDNIKLSNTLDLVQNKGIQVHGIYSTNYMDVSAFNTLTSSTEGKAINLSNPSWGNELSSVIGDSIGGSAGSVIEEEDMPILPLQIGPNFGDIFEVKLFDARVSKLGIHDISVDTTEKISEAISKIDNAMIMVSKQRSKFGAYQNTLEHVNNNISNYKENLVAAESRIRDADISKEITEMQKHQILLQSSQSILTQINSTTEVILDLLK